MKYSNSYVKIIFLFSAIFQGALHAMNPHDEIRQLGEDRQSKLLYEAIERTDIEEVRKLLRMEVDPNRRIDDDEAMLPLELALCNWHFGDEPDNGVEIIRSFLSHPLIDISSLNQYSQKRLEEFRFEDICYRDDTLALKVLLDANNTLSNQYLQRAIDQNKPNIVEFCVGYLNNGESNSCPLYYALALRRVDCVDVLLNCSRIKITRSILKCAQENLKLLSEEGDTTERYASVVNVIETRILNQQKRAIKEAVGGLKIHGYAECPGDIVALIAHFAPVAE